MDKEQILSTLNEQLGKTSLSARTISDYVANNLPEEGAEFDFDRHVKILKSLNGNFSADVAAQVEDFKKNYKPATAQEPPKQDPQPNKEVEELRKQLADLAQRFDKKESQQTQEQLMAKVKAEMVKQGAEDEYVLKQTLRDVTLDAKKSVADLAKELMQSYDSEFTACRGKGAAPRNGGQGSGSNGKNAAADYFARKQKKEGWGKQPDK